MQPVYKNRKLFKNGYPFSASENRLCFQNYEKNLCPNAEKLHFEEIIINEHIRYPHNQSDIQDIIIGMNKLIKNEQNIFLKGSIIGLRAPDLKEDIDNGNWHEWFNSLSTTKYLEHGIYPNTLEVQREFVSKEISNDKTLMFSIRPIDT